MPHMDGIEVCRKLRKERPQPYRYILMVTARTEPQDLVEAMEAGCDDYLTKPFVAHELRVRLRAGSRILEAIAGTGPSLIPSSRAERRFPSCMLSHSSKDSDLAQRLFAGLDGEGVLCWFAPEDLKIGSDLRETFDSVIGLKDRLLLVLSQNSIRSPWVEREVERALDEENRRRLEGRRDWRILFPIRLDDAIFDVDAGWATDVKRRFIGDFCDWREPRKYEAAFRRLLRDLEV